MDDKQLEERSHSQQQADALFKEGVKLVLKDSSEAVELLGKCLEIRNKLYGNEALECAETYYHYGRALLEQARESTDALGSSKVREDVRKEEARQLGGAGPSAQTGDEAQKEDAEEVCKDDVKADGAEGGDGAEKQGKGEEEEEEEDGGQEGEEDGDDLSLPWEMLEFARAIYVQDGADKHLSALADVHLRMGDLNAEKEDFSAAIDEYQQCIAYVNRLPEEPGSDKQRRLAEVHFDMIIPLQFDDRVPEALSHCRSAQKLMRVTKDELTTKLDTPVENETEEEADEEIERLEAELENINGVLAELKDKEEELVKASEQNASMKSMLKSMMQNLASAEGTPGPAQAGPSVSPAKPTLSAADPMERGLAPLGDGKAPTGPVRHMGVAGRGRTRITLQPQPSANQQQQQQQPAKGAPLQPSSQLPNAAPAPHGASISSSSGTQQHGQQAQPHIGLKAAAPLQQQPQQQQQPGSTKRRFEDLMGGGGAQNGSAGARGQGVSTIGFGAGSQGAKPSTQQTPRKVVAVQAQRVQPQQAPPRQVQLLQVQPQPAQPQHVAPQQTQPQQVKPQQMQPQPVQAVVKEGQPAQGERVEDGVSEVACKRARVAEQHGCGVSSNGVGQDRVGVDKQGQQA
ncbi:hypothetical protein DUNSADRAFT_4360 [Dunaliella salina]|uniref:Tetratricopeptide SHNi-TPR domain-containing protein n=1 Tax=Dunaliella salina TaxID=3046 RepID=A0ABQ7GS48_DUNSA|nr:hypothetical protein DUNSADRAFT_4360 [Dunaliella salina]|eukprot:KAF5837444.1 hypothetical protein DUNSADRAFT_4360 [Dunaliella salina]